MIDITNNAKETINTNTNDDNDGNNVSDNNVDGDSDSKIVIAKPNYDNDTNDNQIMMIKNDKYI